MLCVSQYSLNKIEIEEVNPGLKVDLISDQLDIRRLALKVRRNGERFPIFDATFGSIAVKEDLTEITAYLSSDFIYGLGGNKLFATSLQSNIW